MVNWQKKNSSAIAKEKERKKERKKDEETRSIARSGRIPIDFQMASELRALSRSVSRDGTHFLIPEDRPAFCSRLVFFMDAKDDMERREGKESCK